MKKVLLHIIALALIAQAGATGRLSAYASDTSDITETAASAVVVGSLQDASLSLQDASRPEYIIGAGDVLDVSVWKDEALTKQVVVLPDGTISFPLIGQLRAGGRSLRELRQDLEEKIKPYVPEPVLSLEVRQVNSMLIYVIGRVNTPGRFPVNVNITVLQGLAIAGGLNPFAKRSKIRVVREENGKNVTFPFNYDDVVEGKHFEQNIGLKRGDLIIVP
ncbi:MAG: polysaccharide export protein [Syntrophales bacterium LBB04]|nr:polysaccharide export protein [Syntrophales bacterium LBB04]